MPSQLALPTVTDYVSAFHRGVKAKRDKREDGRSGALYDYVGGVTALALARLSPYARDCFRAKYFDDSDGDDLTEYVQKHFGIARILDTRGTGYATLFRPTATAGLGTLWAGTRLKVLVPGSEGLFYSVAQDTPVSASAQYLAGVPIRATFYGPGSAIDTATGAQPVVVDDPLWDASFEVTHLVCADGTAYEKAPDFRARTRALVQQFATGYPPAIAAACQSLGAANVAVFGTNTGGSDLHACAVYVGDAGFNAIAGLVSQITVALEGTRLLGGDAVIGAMQNVPTPVVATVQLYDSPAKFDTQTLATACEGAIRRVFGATGAYGYNTDALFGAVVEVSSEVQNVTFTTPTGSVGVLVNGWFPSTLSRYSIPPGAVSLTFTGP